MSRKFHVWLVVSVIGALACGQDRTGDNLTELQRVQSGTLNVVVLSSRDGLRHGHDSFFIDFRSTGGGALVDVGTVSGTATMAMAGMPMLGTIDIKKTTVTGRYEATSELSMAGSWRMTIDWNGPAGQGTATVPVAVQ